MKTTINRFALGRNAMSIFSTMTLLLFCIACSDEDPQGTNAATRATSSSVSRTDASNARSSSSAGDYNIALTVVGDLWTYVITKNAGAKDLSNFSLNLQNCGLNSSTIENILWATVNGQPADLQSSNGNNGCDIQSVTTNFVKFDNLPSAQSYTIIFQMDRVYGNFVGTTAWLKAGTGCFSYPVLAPCCPL